MDFDDSFTVNTAKKQRGKPFKKGTSGNPNGRPKGSRNKTTLAMMTLIDEEAETITRKVVERAKAGDMNAIKLVMERIYPPRKDTPILFDLDNISEIHDIVPALDNLLQSVSTGQLTPNEAKTMASLIEQQRKAILTDSDYLDF